MSASPTSAVASTKRPLEDPSSPAGPNDIRDAKRQALDKTVTDSTTTTEQEKAKSITNGSHPEASPSTLPPPDTSTTDAANGSTEVKSEPQPIPSTAASTEQVAVQPPPPMPTQDESQWIHVRSVISSSEAATVIGKGGENVSQIRRMSGAKCTVSDYSRGAVERILTVSGAQDAVAKVDFAPVLASSNANTVTGFWTNHSHFE